MLVFKLTKIIATINCGYSMDNRQAMKYIKSKAWLEDFQYNSVFDLGKERFFIRAEGSRIVVGTPLNAGSYNHYAINNLTQDQVLLKNIKIIKVEDVYEESLDIDGQNPYETHIELSFSIWLQFEETQMVQEVKTF